MLASPGRRHWRGREQLHGLARLLRATAFRPGPPHCGGRLRRRTSRRGLFRVRPTPGAALAMWSWLLSIASLPFRVGSAAFWRYDVPANSWTPVANAPAAVGAGRRSGLRRRPDTSMPSEATTAQPSGGMTLPSTPGQQGPIAPAAVGAGGALAYDGARYIYAFRGNNRTTFWRYDTTLNTWAASGRCAGHRGCWWSPGLRWSPATLYAFRGNNRTTFWRYDTVANNWLAMTNAPASVAAGGALAYDGSGHVYGSRGSGTTAFWRYDIAGNFWTPVTSTPTAVLAGGALA